MRVLLAGANGQLGRELSASLPAGYTLLALGSTELDIRDATAVAGKVEEFRPELIINAAAYTAVDRAETEPDLAFAVNATGAGNLARAARDNNARLFYVSTDFVFDGEGGRLLLPQDPPAPLGVYGASKLAGERAVRDSGCDWTIVRTAWLYSAFGNNFVKTMLRLMAEREEIRVVADQVGTPTWAGTLARSLWGLAKRKASGILHCTDAGVASWYDFAVAIQEEALALGLLQREIEILPVRTEDYPTPARRPPYSVLDKTATWELLAMRPPHWRQALRQMLKESAEC